MAKKKNLPKNFYLLDSSNYVCYRINATITYMMKSENMTRSEVLGKSNEKNFKKVLEQHYLKTLQDFFDKTSEQEEREIFLCRDDKKENLWRTKLEPKYKGNRDKINEKIPEDEKISKYIAYVYKTIVPKIDANLKIVRVSEAECDDIIAVVCKCLAISGHSRNVYVLSDDNDFLQLYRNFPDIKILTPRGKHKGWKLQENPFILNPDYLFDKIKKGDRGDNIGAVKKTNFHYNFIKNAQLIDFDYIPIGLKNKILDEVVKVYPDFKNFIPREMINYKIQLGLCCLNTVLREEGIFASRSITLAKAKENIDVLYERAMKNCEDVVKMIHWNNQNNIKVFRLSSSIFPHFSNKTRGIDYSLEPFQEVLSEIGRVARYYNQRLTFHPGQYNVVGTPTEDAFMKTIEDLDYHAEVLDRIGCDENSVMVVHGGGTYGDKGATKKRWIKNFKKLPERVRRRLVLENCEKNFNIVDCLEISDAVSIPVVFDTHHYDCYKTLHPEEKLKPPEYYIDDILNTWNRRSIKPKFHISEQCCENEKTRIGKHSKYIEKIPDYLLNIDQDIDIMVEAKMKEQAIFKLIDYQV